MSSRAFVVALWGPRSEPKDEVARRCGDMVAQLGSVDDVLNGWYLKAKSRASATEPMGDDVASRLMQQRTDVDGRPIPDLGYSLDVWNGSDRAAASVSIVAGVTSDAVSNVVRVTLPDESVAPRLYSVDVMTQILGAVVRCWDPEQAWVGSTSLLDLQMEPLDGHPRVGWLTYLCSSYEVKGHLPPMMYREEMHKGVLLTYDSPWQDVEAAACSSVRGMIAKR